MLKSEFMKIGCLFAAISTCVMLLGCEGSTSPNEASNLSEGVLKDTRDGQVYKTVTIGSQTWMAENLNYRYEGKTSSLDSSSICYNNDPDSCAKYGRLYMWSAAMDSAGLIEGNVANNCGDGVECSVTEPFRGVCPHGWHLPSEEEWNTLIETVSNDYAKEYEKFLNDPIGRSYAKAKRDSIVIHSLLSVAGWCRSWRGDECVEELVGLDIYGFSALPAGFYDGGDLGMDVDSDGVGRFVNFDGVGRSAKYWCSSGSSGTYATNGILEYFQANTNDYTSPRASEDGVSKKRGLSIRCVKD